MKSLAGCLAIAAFLFGCGPQGNSGLATLDSARSGGEIDFDLDQGVHWDVSSEWWYYTGHLRSDGGRTFGFELCFFRFESMGYFAHVAITDDAGHRFHHVRRVIKPTDAHLGERTVAIQYNNDSATQTAAFLYLLRGAVDASNDLELKLESTKKPLIINGDGNIAMPNGESRYYSLTRLAAAGNITVDGQRLSVQGQAWMDHQWGNFGVINTRWDWLALQMDDGTDYNLFSFRNRDGSIVSQYVNVAAPDGEQSYGTSFEIRRLTGWQSPETGERFATNLFIQTPDMTTPLLVKATLPDQEMSPTSTIDIAPDYWEGRSLVRHGNEANAGGGAVIGAAYVEEFPFDGQIP